MAFKTLIFLGVLAIALGFTLPEEQLVNSEPIQLSAGDELVLVRRARSPQGRLTGHLENSQRQGSSATIDYTRPINKNVELYAQAQRNFKYNDNSGHAGLRIKF